MRRERACIGSGMRSESLSVRAVILLSLALLASHRAAHAAVPEEVERALLGAARDHLEQSSSAGAGIGSGSGRADSVRDDATDSGTLSVTEQLVPLSPTERAELSEVLDAKVAESLSRYVVARSEGDTVLFGYLDTHRVRTVSESLLITLTPSGEVRDVLVLAFAEPPEYRPAPVWYAQFRGLEPESRLKYGREIDAVTGATLTGRATVDAVSRVRKIHRWLLGQKARQ